MINHSLSTDDDDSIVTAAIAQFWRSFDSFPTDFGHISPYLQYKLFKHCYRFYYAPMWLLSSHIVNKVCTAWKKALRKMWRLSPMTHCDVITLISDCIPLDVSLQLRFCKFSPNIIKYGSKVLKTVAKVALRNPFSTYCNSLLEITDQCVQFNINECHSLSLKSWYYSITDEMSSNINVLKDMIDI